MATHTFSEFHFAEAEALIDLESILFDLRDAVWKAEYLLESFSKDEQLAYKISEAYCIAALIKYGRAFGSSVRKIDKTRLLKDLPSKIEKSHEYFMNWRDKHIAHSVNDFEVGKIQARYCAERVKEEGITSVTVSQARIASLSSMELEKLKETANFFIKRLKPMIDEEKSKMLDLLRSLPIKEVIDRNEPVTVPVVDHSRAKKSRKRK